LESKILLFLNNVFTKRDFNLFKKFGKMVLQAIKNKNSFALSSTQSPILGNAITQNWQKLFVKSESELSLNAKLPLKRSVVEVIAESFIEASKINIDSKDNPNLISDPLNCASSDLSVYQSKAITQKLMCQLNKTAFVPNQTNKIYPLISNAMSSIDRVIQAPIQSGFSVSEIESSKIKLPFLLKKQDGLAYIKRETYPKFSSIQSPIYHSFDSKNHASENSSNSELLKKNSFDDELQEDKN
jgi:hypothetical protein